jgi:hypothetical protein
MSIVGTLFTKISYTAAGIHRYNMRNMRLTYMRTVVLIFKIKKAAPRQFREAAFLEVSQ